MKPRAIFETLFNHYHDLGVVGVFGNELSRQIVGHIQCVNQNAEMVGTNNA